MNKNSLPLANSNTQNFTAGKTFSTYKFLLGVAFLILPVAILFVWYLKIREDLSARSEEIFLAILIIGWVLVGFFIRKEYKKTLTTSIKKGHFTGSESFLKKKVVANSLLQKTESNKPLEVIHSLDLLEKSGYNDLENLLLKNLKSPLTEIKDFVLSRIMANNFSSALPALKQELALAGKENVQPKLVEAFYYLDRETVAQEQITALQAHQLTYKKAAIKGLLQRNDALITQLVIESMAANAGGNLKEKLSLLEIIADCQEVKFTGILQTLLDDDDPNVYKKAIEAAGKIRDTALFDEVLEVTVAKKAYHSFKRSIVYYGDNIFSKTSIRNPDLPEELLGLIIKSIGNIKGENSTAFLTGLLKSKTRFYDEIIEALWLKKADPTPEGVILVNDWVARKNEQTKQKATYLKEVINRSEIALLQQAMLMEVRNDLQQLLKAFALLHDRKKIDSVIEQLYFGNTSRISNHFQKIITVIPANYFTDLFALVQVIDEPGGEKTAETNTRSLNVEMIIEGVLKDSKANFSEWTRSIACYILPQLNNAEFSLRILQGNLSKGDQLFNDTRSNVLTKLNN